MVAKLTFWSSLLQIIQQWRYGSGFVLQVPDGLNVLSCRGSGNMLAINRLKIC